MSEENRNTQLELKLMYKVVELSTRAKRAETALSHAKDEISAKDSVLKFMREEAQRTRDELAGKIAEYTTLRNAYQQLNANADSNANGKEVKSEFEKMLQSVLIESSAEGRPVEEKYTLMQLLILSQIATEIYNIRRVLIEKSGDLV